MDGGTECTLWLYFISLKYAILYIRNIQLKWLGCYVLPLCHFSKKKKIEKKIKWLIRSVEEANKQKSPDYLVYG